MKPPVVRWGLRDHGNVFLLVGPPGTGKTVLASRIADDIHGERPVYCSMSQRHGRPEYYKRSGEGFHDSSVELVTDASLTLHARRYMVSGNVIVDMQTAVRRHRDLDIIYDVQNSGTLDVNAIRAADVTILKGPPSSNMIDTERPAVIRKYERAFRYLGVPEPLQDEYEGPPSRWALDNAYVTAPTKNFVLEDIKVPSYWNEEISEDDIGKRREVRLPGWIPSKQIGEEIARRLR